MSDGNWVTINGVHVLIGGDGKIAKGPAKFIGSTVNDLKGQKMTADRKAELQKKYGDKKSTTTSKKEAPKKETSKSSSSGSKSSTSATKKSTTTTKSTTPTQKASTTTTAPKKMSQDDALNLAIKNAEAKYGSKTKEADVRREFRALTGKGIASDVRVYSKQSKSAGASKTTTESSAKTSVSSAKTQANKAVSKYRDEKTTPFGQSKEAKNSNAGQVVSSVRNNVNGGLEMVKAFGLKASSSDVAKMQDYFDVQAMNASKRGAKVVSSQTSPFSGKFEVRFSDGTVASYQIGVE